MSRFEQLKANLGLSSCHINATNITNNLPCLFSSLLALFHHQVKFGKAF